MLDIHYIRENWREVEEGIAAKNMTVDIKELLAIDEKRLEVLKKVEELRALKNKASQEIGKAAPDMRAKLIEDVRAFDGDSDRLTKQLAQLTEKLDVLLEQLPNIPAADVPRGKNEDENVELRRVGEIPTFAFEPKEHTELGKNLGVIESEQAVKVSGARFVYLLGNLVMLQNALHQYVLSILTNREALEEIIRKAKLSVPSTPFVPVVPPLMIKPEVFKKMARLEPQDERYHIPSDDVFLIGSAEHTLGPIHMDEILPEDSLPRRYVANTPAFRREAGSYGKDTRGIIRVHQFSKMEMESFTVAETSIAEQNFFVAIEEHIVASLGIPYRVMMICTGDMGTPDARQIDIECWMPGQNRYRETHTSDLMTDYQARRLNTRVRRTDGRMEFVHMNDATAVADRMLVAIMENYQEADGSIAVPSVLHPFLPAHLTRMSAA